MPNFIDITGNTYFYLTVLNLNREKSDQMGCLYWDCKCKCGKIITVAGNSLKSGRQKSCGCWNKETVAQRNKEIKRKSNRIEFDENLGCYRGYFNSSDEYFLFDIEDLDVVEQYCWYKDNKGYAASTKRDDKNHKHVQMHRVIMAKYQDIDGLEVDHISLNTLDNRRSCNLRIIPHTDNMRNRRPYSNTGEKYISYSGGRYLLWLPNGCSNSYKTIEEAKVARDDYLLNNPNEYRYDIVLDYKNRENLIHPFRFIDPNSIINPFIVIK